MKLTLKFGVQQKAVEQWGRTGIAEQDADEAVSAKPDSEYSLRESYVRKLCKHTIPIYIYIYKLTQELSSSGEVA